MNIVLIGMMGSGKSTIGKLIAKKLGWKFYDSDAMIENEEKSSISEIFQKKGEPAFRELEKKMIAKLSAGENCVLSTGGGAPLFEENWKSFGENSTVVWLKVKPEALFERLKRGGAKARPLLKDSFSLENISNLLKTRDAFYGKANLTVETDGLEVDETVEKVLRIVLPKYK